MDWPEIVVDRREQAPLVFARGIAMKWGTLKAGDYSCTGFEESVAVERKSLADLVQSITSERERFWRELEKLATYAAAAVVVEARMDMMLAHVYRSRVAPASVMGSCHAITLDFGLPVVWAGDRETAAAWVASYIRLATKRPICSACGRAAESVMMEARLDADRPGCDVFCRRCSHGRAYSADQIEECWWDGDAGDHGNGGGGK